MICTSLLQVIVTTVVVNVDTWKACLFFCERQISTHWILFKISLDPLPVCLVQIYDFFFLFFVFFFQKKKKSPDARRLLKVPEELSSNYSVSWRRFACGTQNGGEWARGSRCVNDCDRSCHCWQREGGKKNKKKFNASKMSLKLLVLFQMISSPGFFSFSRKIYEA